MDHSIDQIKNFVKINYPPKDGSELQASQPTLAEQLPAFLPLSPSLSPLVETYDAYHDRKRRGRLVGGPGHAQVQAVLADGRVVEPHLLPCIGTASQKTREKRMPDAK